jgi:Ca2+-transporting ATPase
LFSTNLSEVLLVATGAILAYGLNLRDNAGGLVLPLTAAQILWINLMTDGVPALALALDRTPGVMRQPPRPADSPLLDRPSVRFIMAAGSMKAALALGILGLVPRLGYDLDVARATTFHFMAIGQLLLTYPSRHTWMRPLANTYLHAAVITGIGIQVVVAWLPSAANLLGNAGIPRELWGLAFGGAFLAWGLAETLSRLAWRHHMHEPEH